MWKLRIRPPKSSGTKPPAFIQQTRIAIPILPKRKYHANEESTTPRIYPYCEFFSATGR
jgi:hypothetical protein